MGRSINYEIRFHGIAFIVGSLLAFLSIRYLILVDTHIITEYRDIIVFPNMTQLWEHIIYTWPSKESVMPFWSYIPRLILAQSPETYIRLTFFGYYLIEFFIPYLAFFYLLKVISKLNEKNSFLVSMIIAYFYSTNPFIIQLYSPPHLYVISYSFLPLLLLFYVLFINNPTWRLSILLAIVFTIIITPIIRYAIHSIVLVVVITLLHLTYTRGKMKYKEVFLYLFAVIIVTILLNSYWILPIMTAKGSNSLSPPYILTEEFIELISSKYTPIKVFLLQASWWPTLKLRPLFNNPIFLLIPNVFLIAFGISSLLATKKISRKGKMFTIIQIGFVVYLIGSLLWMGANRFSPVSKIYKKLIFELPPYIGWVFRVPGHFGALVVLGLSIGMLVGLVGIYRNFQFKKIFGILLIMLFIAPSAVGWQRFTGDLDGILKDNGYYLEATMQYEKIPFTKSLVILSSNYTGTFKPHRTGKQYTNIPRDLYLYLLEKTGKHILQLTMNILSADALITDIDEPTIQCEHCTICYIAKDNVNLYVSATKPNPVEAHYQILYSLDSLNYEYYGSLSLLADVVPYMPTVSPQYSLITTNKLNVVTPYISASSIKSIQAVHIYPSRMCTDRKPSVMWSIAYTSDPLHGEWHPILDSLGIENWQSDYGKGLVFTWATKKYPEKLPEKISPTYEWTFESKDNIEEWLRLTPTTQWGVPHVIIFDEKQKALKAELWGSSWGWKTINSPLIPADSNKVYRIELNIKGKNTHGVHIKIFEFDENNTLLSSKYITGVGSSTFDWKTITFNYQPQNENTKYLQLQIWHGHETDKPLPNIIWIDDVKVYDITNYTKPVTLEIPFKVDKTDNYKLFIRYFKNQKGGAIRVYLDETPIYIKTKDQLNKFVWEELGTFKLEKGGHKIVLENVRGFNAVNLFALIPENEYYRAKEEIKRLLQNKTVIYIFEAESDLYRSNADTVKNINASNGEAWQNVEIVKSGTYKIALKGVGTFNISIGNYSYILTLNNLTFKYTPMFYLRNGEYKLKIIPLSKDVILDVVWLYSTNNNETLEKLFQVKETPAQVQNYTKINPTLWKVKVNATKPFMLTFAESYDPLWEARVYKNGKLVEKVSPVPVYGVINGFWINQTGELEIVLRYTPQDWFERGLIISLTTFILSLSYIFYDWRREKGDKWAKRLEEKFRRIKENIKTKSSEGDPQ